MPPRDFASGRNPCEGNDLKYYKPGPDQAWNIVKMSFQPRRFNLSIEIKTLKRTCIQRNKRTTIKRFRSQSSVWTKKQPRRGKQLQHVQAFKNERYVKDLKQHTTNYRRVRAPKHTLLWVTRKEQTAWSVYYHQELVWIWSKQQGAINHWLGSGRAVNNFSALMKDVQQPWRVQRIKS